MRSKPFVIILLIFTFSSSALLGQKKINSPYSRFNIGSLVPAGPFRSLAMGGTGVAMRDNNSVYFYNPASYTSIDSMSFLFDFGADFSKDILDDGTNKFSSLDANFNHLFIGFPISNRFGFAAGLIPMSNGYYYISDVTKPGGPNYDPNVGEVTYIHKGTGSLGNFFVGTGARVTKRLSLGVNMSIVFGGLTRLNQFEFADYANVYNQNASENLRIHGIRFDYGLQYSTPIMKKYFFTVGIDYTAEGKFGSSKEVLATRFTAYNTSKVDTLVHTTSDSRDSTKFPGSIRAGISFGKTDKFTVEMDYVYTGWAKGMIHGDNSTLANTSAYMIGFEYIPEKYSNTSFLKRVEYRLGGHIADNYLILNGVQVKEYGASLGMAFRLRSTPSKASLYFDFTRKVGDLSKGMFNENIYTVGISLNLYDFWFLKRKYE
jgi:hypothetical protein